MADNYYVYEEENAQVYNLVDEEGNQFIAIKTPDNTETADYSGLGFLALKTSDLIIRKMNKKDKEGLEMGKKEKQSLKSKVAETINQGKQYWEEHKEPLIRTFVAVGFAFIGASPAFFIKDDDDYDYFEDYNLEETV